MSWYDSILPYAQQAHQATNIPVSDIMAQWGLETGNGKYLAASNNLAGITDGKGNFVAYSSLSDFTQGWIKTINNGYYKNVLSTAQGGGSPDQVAASLGQSPWAESHYTLNGVPGGSLVNMMKSYDLYQYDHAGSAAPVVTSMGGTQNQNTTSIGGSSPLMAALGSDWMGNWQTNTVLILVGILMLAFGFYSMAKVA